MASKDFIIGLLHLYKDNVCLWKSTSADYTNRNIKNKAYNKLVMFSKQFYKDADKNFVKQKLQNLRTSFRKEFKKVEESKKSGAGVDDIYVPRLWYYPLLTFIEDIPHQSSESKKRRLTEDYHNEYDIIYEYDDDSDGEKLYNEELESSDTPNNIEIKFENSDSVDIDTINTPPSPSGSNQLSQFFQPSLTKQKATQQRKTTQKKENDFYDTCSQGHYMALTCSEAISKIVGKREPPETHREIDECEALGITWAAKMRKLDEYQKVLAEDLIGQVLKMAYFKELTRTTGLSDASPIVTNEKIDTPLETVRNCSNLS